MKKDFWIYIVCLGLLFTCGYLFYGEVNHGEKCIKNNGSNEIMSNYNNYTKITENVLNSQNKYKRLDLEISDGKLMANLNYQSLDVKGIEGSVKSFIISRDSCSDDANKWLIAIDDTNNLYMTNINYYDQNDYMTFKKISLDEEIKDITDLDFNVSFSTCGRVNTAVVLKDNSVHQLRYEKDKNTFAMLTADVSNFKKSIGINYMVYKDNTVGLFDTHGKYDSSFNERLKYNGIELKASIIYESYFNNEIVYYIVSDNKLYKVESTYDDLQITDSKVSLVNDKRIAVNLYQSSNKLNYYDIDISFEDDSTYTIKDINQEFNID